MKWEHWEGILGIPKLGNRNKSLCLFSMLNDIALCSYVHSLDKLLGLFMPYLITPQICLIIPRQRRLLIIIDSCDNEFFHPVSDRNVKLLHSMFLL